MLRSVSIKNYLSCGDVKLDSLESITAFVGRNGAGKSNILRSISRICEAALCTNSIEYFLNFDLLGNSSQFSIDFDCGNQTYRYQLGCPGFRLLKGESASTREGRDFFQESLSIREADGKDTPVFTRIQANLNLADRTNSLNIGLNSSSLAAIFAILPDADLLFQKLQPVRNFLSSVRFYPLDEPSTSNEEDGFIVGDKYHHWLTQFRATGDAGSSVLMKLLHLYLTNPPKFAEIQESIGTDGLSIANLSSWAEMVSVPKQPDFDETPSNYYRVGFGLKPSPDWRRGSRTLSFANLSHGTRRLIQLITSIVFDESAVMLIEHPEEMLHSALLKKVIGYLKAEADPKQFLLTSHSADVLNNLRPESIVLVEMIDGLTTTRKLSEGQTKAAIHFIENEGSLSEYIELAEQGN